MRDNSSPDDVPASASGSPEPARPKVTRARAKTVGKTTRPKAAKTADPSNSAAEPAAPAATLVAEPAASPPVTAAPPEAADTTPLRDVTITQGGLDTARAASIRITQGGIGQAEGAAIDVVQGGIGRAQATDIAVSQGAIGFARGDRVSLEMGAMGVAVAREARVQQAYARVVVAREAKVEQAAIGTMAAARVTFERTTAVGIVIAGRVDGTVRPLLDWRGALAIGAVLALLVGILRLRDSLICPPSWPTDRRPPRCDGPPGDTSSFAPPLNTHGRGPRMQPGTRTTLARRAGATSSFAPLNASGRLPAARPT